MARESLPTPDVAKLLEMHVAHVSRFLARMDSDPEFAREIRSDPSWPGVESRMLHLREVLHGEAEG